MKTNILTSTKALFNNTKRKADMALIAASTTLALSPASALAAGLSADDSLFKGKITSLANVLLGAATAGGIIVLVFGGLKFALSYQKQDQNGEHEALKTIITGLMLAGLSTIVNLLI